MKRIFTQTVSGRYKAGQIRDWPMSTWSGLANSLHMDLDEFSRSWAEKMFVEGIEEGSSLSDTLLKRGPGRPRKEESNASTR